MEVLRTISVFSATRGTRFIVIGGHALNAHGIARHTGDLDLAVPKSERDSWLELMKIMGYTDSQLSEAFSRHCPPQLAAWPIDFMYVDDATFSKLAAEATPKDLGGVSVPVVSPRHLVAMKLHALGTGEVERRSKDLGDLAALLSRASTHLNRAQLESLCRRYHAEAFFEELSALIPAGTV